MVLFLKKRISGVFCKASCLHGSLTAVSFRVLLKENDNSGLSAYAYVHFFLSLALYPALPPREAQMKFMGLQGRFPLRYHPDPSLE